MRATDCQPVNVNCINVKRLNQPAKRSGQKHLTDWFNCFTLTGWKNWIWHRAGLARSGYAFILNDPQGQIWRRYCVIIIAWFSFHSNPIWIKAKDAGARVRATRSDLAPLLCYYYCLIFFSLQSNLNQSKGCRCSNSSHKVRGAVSVTVEISSSRWYKFWYKYWYINTDINTDNKYWYKFPDDTFNFEAYQYK